MTGSRAAVSSPLGWWERARCAGRGPSAVFFPADGGDDRQAKAWCTECPVRTECLDWGLEEAHGVWGGLSHRERRRLVRARTALQQRNASAEVEAMLTELVGAGLDAAQAQVVLGLDADEVTEQCGVRPRQRDLEVTA